ncbi:hypothetical protein HanIR_Chr10g0466151 [Helianthus annuus]|nr:hypothetical protein HanIR_Chr10g0466151 [Helianthus annuus]
MAPASEARGDSGWWLVRDRGGGGSLVLAMTPAPQQETEQWWFGCCVLNGTGRNGESMIYENWFNGFHKGFNWHREDEEAFSSY